MKCKNVRIAELQSVAQSLGMYLNDLKPVGRFLQFTLRPGPYCVYRRVSCHSRRVHAVCWHEHRDFFRAIYRMVPDAVFKTAYATYENTEHFEQTFPQTGYRNIGSMYQPLSAESACECPEGSFEPKPKKRNKRQEAKEAALRG